MRSIRAFMLASVLGVVFVCMLVFFVSTYLQSRHEVDEVYDSHLAQSARMLNALLSHNLRDKILSSDSPLVLNDEQLNQDLNSLSDDEVSQLGHSYENKLVYQLWTTSGKLILRSNNAPQEKLIELQAGFETIQLKGKRWRSFTLRDNTLGVYLIVAEQLEVREELIDEITENLLTPFVVGIPLLLLALWYLIGRGLHPLVMISKAIKHRQAKNLEPIVIEGLSSELKPIETSLNSLLFQLKGTLEREKSFTDDAAHELRTPLAQIKVHAQNAQSSKDDQNRLLSLKLLDQSVDQATRTIEQLLHLARLQSSSTRTENDKVNLDKLAREQIAAMNQIFSQRQQSIELASPEQLKPIQGNGLLIGLLIRNLLENASLYTHVTGSIRLSIVYESGRQSGTTLIVEDNGPGVDDSQYENIFKRFHRENPGDSNGAGLGLSIVSRIAELHDASIISGSPVDPIHTGFCLHILFD